MGKALTEIESKYFNFVCDFVFDEVKNNFDRTIDEDHKAFLDSYAINSMGQLGNLIIGLKENENVFNAITDEVRVALRIGYCVRSAYDRFSLESEEFKAFEKNKNKTSVKKVINNILDSLKIR